MQYDYGQWWLVALNIGIFGYFIWSSFKPQTKVDWQSFRLIMAFIVALFFEMYGFPLTVFLLTSVFGNRLGIDFSHNNGHLLETFLRVQGDPHFNWLHILSNVLIIGGILLIGAAWKVLYNAAKKHILATTGPYAYVRHPQYLGFILIIIGFLIQWPTVITFLMAPVLIWRYLRLGRQEEQQALAQFGNRYQFYRQQTSGYLPKTRLLSFAISRWLFPKTSQTGNPAPKKPVSK